MLICLPCAKHYSEAISVQLYIPISILDLKKYAGKISGNLALYFIFFYYIQVARNQRNSYFCVLVFYF